MSYFIKVYIITISIIIVILLALALLALSVVNPLPFVTSFGFWALISFSLALYMWIANFMIMVAVAAPFYLLMQNFWHFNFIAAILLGLLVGLANHFAFMGMFELSFLGNGLSAFLLLGAIFGMIFYVALTVFNKGQKINDYEDSIS